MFYDVIKTTSNEIIYVIIEKHCEAVNHFSFCCKTQVKTNKTKNIIKYFQIKIPIFKSNVFTM